MLRKPVHASTMPLASAVGDQRCGTRLTVGLARSAEDVEQAQRLRFKVFAQQMRAPLHRIKPGLDVDAYDSWCDHLIVREAASQRVVGTYRILPPHRVRKVGQLYAESEFDLSRFEHLRASMIEVGRACVHPDYRSGSAILLLWAGLAAYMKRGGYRHLVGCASVSIKDGGHGAARLRVELQRAMSDLEYRVYPHLPFPYQRIGLAAACAMPPLIKAYLRLGAQVCGEPAWDPDFNSADFFLWLSLDRLNMRYARHFDLLARSVAWEAPG